MTTEPTADNTLPCDPLSDEPECLRAAREQVASHVASWPWCVPPHCTMQSALIVQYIDSLRSELSEVREERDALKQKVEVIGIHYNDAFDLACRFERDLAAANERIAEVEKRNGWAKHALELDASGSADAIVKLRAELAERDAEIARLKDQIRDKADGWLKLWNERQVDLATIARLTSEETINKAAEELADEAHEWVGSFGVEGVREAARILRKHFTSDDEKELT